ncbi:hypothetical protein SDC9_138615 [bioreactor metagenome]|uniref:Uncharacterized protein n=1 Tax=bioreactor metagenome TaxID=1076179 RepID=A0A645DPT4_9ZZZZ
MNTGYAAHDSVQENRDQGGQFYEESRYAHKRCTDSRAKHIRDCGKEKTKEDPAGKNDHRRHRRSDHGALVCRYCAGAGQPDAAAEPVGGVDSLRGDPLQRL